MSTAYIGEPISRVDGRAKVTGGAKYATEYNIPDLVHGCVVSSTIAKGKITRIDAADALRLPGVLQVLTHENAPRLERSDSSYVDEVGPPGEPFCPLRDAEIRFSMQPVALVVAENCELGRYAASLVRVEYESEPHVTDPEVVRAQAILPKRWAMLPPVPKSRGDAARALANGAARVDAEYRIPIEHHNPMELFGTTVIRERDGKLTVYDKTQGVQNVQGYLCSMLGYSADDILVLAPFVGGAFGVGLRPQYPAFLACLAAHVLKRSVRVSLTRQQMFSLGYRPDTWQRVALAAAPDGGLVALIHEAVGITSRFEDYVEKTLLASGKLYQCDNATFDYKVVQLDLQTPIDMRAPGIATGLFALESAMDELAVKLRIDPLDIRLKNYAEVDQDGGVPFSSKKLRECYQQGAERFGWARRNPEPRSMRDGSTLIGCGMASGMYDALQAPASAKCVLTADGKLTVSSATADIGTGTYTIITQIAAELLGLPLENVTFKLADSSLPKAPVQGDSFTASSVGSAVKVACDKVRERLLTLARKVDNSPLADVALDDATFADGRIRSRRDPSKTVSYTEAMRHATVNSIEEEASAGPSAAQKRYGRYSHSAVFAEVHVDQDLGTIQVVRIVNAVAAGRILNPKTARSQVLGGIVWGIGMALEEESVIDHAFGRIMSQNLGDYHVPVNADVRDIDVSFVEERDEIVNPLGVKGLGEIGVVGVAAAIANAVFHATGKRIRELPITLDKVIGLRG